MNQPPFVPKGVIYRTEEEKRSLESRNGAIQAAFVLSKADEWRRGDSVTVKLLCQLQELAVNQIYRCAGHLRDGPVEVGDHTPPFHAEVPGLVADMCDYINANWTSRTAIHLASYAMWRLNWIHPFFGGNGRTSRAFSYLVLCAGLGMTLPAGEKNIPELIVENRTPYYDALHEADGRWKNGIIDLSAMEDLLSNLLAKQLVAIVEQATGRQLI